MLQMGNIGWACLAVVLCSRIASGQNVTLPDGQHLPAVDFDRHVAPLLSKFDCNSGACHGNSQGKGGFQLSLFGADPRRDYREIAGEESGRIDLEQPSESLLLQKPTMAVDHGGGERFAIHSWEYRLLRAWIAAGAPPASRDGGLLELEITPATIVLTNGRPSERLRVIATFAGGERLDVTHFSTLRLDDERVAVLRDDASISRTGAGDTVVVATYAGRPASAPILAPHASDSAAAAVAESSQPEGGNLIDRFVDARLKRLNIMSSPACNDEVFLRRVTLATTGQLPSVEAVERFVEDSGPAKRDHAIARLLQDPLHASLWATRFCEIMGSRDAGSAPAAAAAAHEDQWHAWFRVRFERNEPYNVMARQILCATTRDELAAPDFIDRVIEARAAGELLDPEAYAARGTLDLFWRRHKVNEEVELESLTERVAAAFLGVRIECAKCHKHPFDRWTQDDFRALANVFTQVRYGMSGELRAAVADKLQQQRRRGKVGQPTVRVPALRELYLTDRPRDLHGAGGQGKLPPRPLGGPVLIAKGDRRAEFARWLTAESNPYFARNFVNRVWAFYFGRGIVDPVDGFSAANPPTHPQLLDALAERFVASGYDVRELEQVILKSRTWQRSAEATPTGRDDYHNYARFEIRVLPAHAIADSIACALGDGDGRARAVSIPTFEAADDELQRYFSVFSRPERTSRCDCERNAAPTLRQAMLLLSDQRLASRIEASMRARVAELSANDRSPASALIDEIFLRSLSRWPSEAEKQVALAHVSETPDLHQAASDVLWSLIASREFMTMH